VLANAPAMARPVNSRVIAFIANILFHEVKRSDWRANATVQFDLMPAAPINR
jgi:hypothetical protein